VINSIFRRTAVRLVCFVIVLGGACPAFAQVDLSGYWGNRPHEDNMARGPSLEVGEYEGYPVNAAARGPVPGSSAGGAATVARPVGTLKVVTTKMRSGYLRKNGVPYSDKAVVTEYFDRLDQPNGDVYLVVTTVVEDPTYLNQPFITSSHFKKQTDQAGWNPAPCAAR